jgi:hypothetical protein
VRIRRDHQVGGLRGCEIHGADQAETLGDERQAAPGEEVGLVEETEVQVRAFTADARERPIRVRIKSSESRCPHPVVARRIPNRRR